MLSRSRNHSRVSIARSTSDHQNLTFRDNSSCGKLYGDELDVGMVMPEVPREDGLMFAGVTGEVIGRVNLRHWHAKCKDCGFPCLAFSGGEKAAAFGLQSETARAKLSFAFPQNREREREREREGNHAPSGVPKGERYWAGYRWEVSSRAREKLQSRLADRGTVISP